MKKRIVCFAISLVIVVTMLPCFAQKAEAATYITTEEITEKLNNWKSKLNGKYWNYYDRSQWDTQRSTVESKLKEIVDNGILDKSGATNAELGVTTTACGGSLYENGCRSNYFSGGWQCFGFAWWLEYALFGSTYQFNPSDWNVYTGSGLNSINLQPGDLVRVSGHSIVVSDVSGGALNCVEAWGGSGCKISWSPGFNWSEYTTASSMLTAVKNIGGTVYRYKYVNAEPSNLSYTVTFNANGGESPSASMTNTLNGINVDRGSGYLVVYNNSGTLLNTNKYGIEVAVDATGKVVGRREYLSDSQMTIPSGGFILSGQGSSGTWVGNIAVGDYVGYDPSTMTVYVYESQAAYSANHKLVTSGNAIGTLPEITRDGYVFQGWYTAASGGTKVTSATTISSDTTLYAHWEKKAAETTYTVTFNANGGTCSVGTKSVSSSETIGTMPTPTRDGYVFAGWYTAASGGTQVTESSMISSNITVYAQWSQKVKTITMYDAFGEMWKTENCEDGSSYTLPSTYPITNGSYFSGWAYTKGSEVFDVRPGGTIDVSSDIRLYPVYVTHAEAVSGEPVLIYNIDDFTADGYDIETIAYKLEQEIDSSYWTDWSDYSVTKITASDTVEVRTTPMYRYYYYLCPGCGDHNPLSGDCGCGSSSYDFRYTWSTVAYSKSNYKTVSYATYKCYTTSLGDGQLWYFSAGNINSTEIGTKDSDSSAVVIDTGYSSRTYVNQTETSTKFIVAYIITETEPVTVNQIEVNSYPSKTTYKVGEPLDVSGLALKVTYSDGSSKTITSGFTASGFDSSTAGKKTVTVNYGGKTTTFSVTVDTNSEVDSDIAEIVLESKSATKGKTLTLSLGLKNNPGFCALQLAFIYNKEYFTLSSVDNQVSSMMMTSGSAYVWDAAENYSEDGTLAVLTFEVDEDVPAGDYEIQVYFMGASNIDFEEVKMTSTSGVITVHSAVYGDANGDGKVSTVDLAMLRRYLAAMDPITGISTITVQVGADVNGDGSIGTVDLAMLRRYLAAMDPVTGESTIVLGPR